MMELWSTVLRAVWPGIKFCGSRTCFYNLFCQISPLRINFRISSNCQIFFWLFTCNFFKISFCRKTLTFSSSSISRFISNKFFALFWWKSIWCPATLSGKTYQMMRRPKIRRNSISTVESHKCGPNYILDQIVIKADLYFNKSQNFSLRKHKIFKISSV